NAAATMPASPIGRISSAAGQARSLLAPSSGVTSPATARLRPSMSAKAEEYPAAFCEPHRSTFTLVPAEDGVEDVDINSRRQVSEAHRRRKARSTGRSWFLDAINRPSSLVSPGDSFIGTIRWPDR